MQFELNGDRWRTPDHVVGEGAAFLEATRVQGLEGVVAKRLDSVYEPGRRSARRSWVVSWRSGWPGAAIASPY